MDSISGSTRQYSNGHSLDWHETDQAVIDDEMELIDLINEERVKRGLPELQYDKALTRCARGHSRHHLEHGGFMGHVNPEGDDFTSRMNNNAIDTQQSGENINYGSFTPLSVFQGWMASPGHAANIHHYCFIRIGVGRHGNVWTANFAR